MTADDVKTNYHLTSNGWVRGAEAIFQVPVETEVTRPESAIVTFQARERDSGYGLPDFTVTEVWRHAAADDKEIRALLRKYGAPEGESGARLRPWKALLG